MSTQILVYSESLDLEALGGFSVRWTCQNGELASPDATELSIGNLEAGSGSGTMPDEGHC